MRPGPGTRATLITTTIAVFSTIMSWQQQLISILDPEVARLGDVKFSEAVGDFCADGDFLFPESVKGNRASGSPENPQTINIQRLGNVVDTTNETGRKYNAIIWKREYSPVDDTITYGEYELFRAVGEEVVHEQLVNKHTKSIPKAEAPIKDNIFACVDGWGNIYIAKDSRIGMNQVDKTALESSLNTSLQRAELNMVSPKFSRGERRI